MLHDLTSEETSDSIQKYFRSLIAWFLLETEPNTDKIPTSNMFRGFSYTPNHYFALTERQVSALNLIYRGKNYTQYLEFLEIGADPLAFVVGNFFRFWNNGILTRNLSDFLKYKRNKFCITANSTYYNSYLKGFKIEILFLKDGWPFDLESVRLAFAMNYDGNWDIKSLVTNQQFSALTFHASGTAENVGRLELGGNIGMEDLFLTECGFHGLAKEYLFRRERSPQFV
jgi:hypothetical protein